MPTKSADDPSEGITVAVTATPETRETAAKIASSFLLQLVEAAMQMADDNSNQLNRTHDGAPPDGKVGAWPEARNAMAESAAAADGSVSTQRKPRVVLLGPPLCGKGRQACPHLVT